MGSNARPALVQEQRSSERFAVRLAGKLFVPAEQITLDCTIINLSAGGAGIFCPEPPPLSAFVVLYMDGFGRFDGVATRYVEGELGLKFVCKDAKRKRLEQDLAAFVREGMVGVTRLRRHGRAVATNQIPYFTRANGEAVACEMMDISLQGAMLKTSLRPPIGEVIQLGQTRGWVVRHHEQGIGVQFQERMAEVNNGQ
ncbi:MAG TPA: PilZ domain-containing protein [Rhizomicrobium sp.]|nr:PilZ domain-containing protein [Rhizomicrobium sp.]